MRKLYFIAAMLLIWSHLSFAGVKEVGGGVVIVCGDKVYLADTFSMVSSFQNRNLLSAEPYKVEIAITKVLEQRYPTIAPLLSQARKSLVWESQDDVLPLLGDDHIDQAVLPSECSKQQVAIQDIPAKRVAYVAPLKKRMSSLEQGLLDFHESLISLRNQPGADTTPIRAVIEEAMQNELKIFASILGRLNSDCRLIVNRMTLTHGCFNVFTPAPEGPGACQTWQSLGPVGQSTFNRTANDHYEIEDHDFSVEASVLFNGRDSARISIQAPGLSQKVTVKAEATNSFLPNDLDAQYATDVVPDASGFKGLQYVISCNFGLSDDVQTILSREEKEIDRLGPPVDWQNPFSASVANLPVGTVFELTDDLDIVPLSEFYGHSKNFFVEEQSEPLTDVTFQKLNLPYRFAFAEISNSNNGFIYPVHYPKGMKIEVTAVELTHLHSAFHVGQDAVEYVLRFKTITSPLTTNGAGKPDLITWMRLDGRRSGLGDVKIPQLMELLKSRFRIVLPGT